MAECLNKAEGGDMFCQVTAEPRTLNDHAAIGELIILVGPSGL